MLREHITSAIDMAGIDHDGDLVEELLEDQGTFGLMSLGITCLAAAELPAGDVQAVFQIVQRFFDAWVERAAKHIESPEALEAYLALRARTQEEG